MKRFLAVTTLLLLSGLLLSLRPQTGGQVVVGGQGVTVITYGAGAPSGNCLGLNYLYVNTSNGDLYSCPNPASTWVKVSGGGSGSGTVSANNGSAGAVANYAAAGGSTTVGPDATATDSGTSFSYSGTGGFKSINGACGTLGYGFTSNANSGFYWDSGNNALGVCVNNATEAFAFYNSLFVLKNTGVIQIGQTGAVNAASDIGLSSDGGSTHIFKVGTGTAGNTQATVQSAGYMAVGTTFTSNAGCGDTTLVGGATAGKYTSVTAGSCTTVITMGNSATAPNGWSCTATDLTTIGDIGNIKQSATTTTTASLNETTVSANDVIQFSCIGY